MTKVAVVTGAGTGVGKAVSLALMRELCARSRRAPQGQARGDGERRQRDRRAEPGGADRRERVDVFRQDLTDQELGGPPPPIGGRLLRCDQANTVSNALVAEGTDR
jgi:NAD(P)-dependent dehydrogenase (short-subunit alcohol dehydrogenase family)